MSTTLYCHCAHASIIPEGTKRAALVALASRDEAFVAVPDLCGVSASGGTSLAGYARIAACYPRAVRWLLARARVDLDGTEVLNLRELSAEEIVSAIAAPVGAGRAASIPASAPSKVLASNAPVARVPVSKAPASKDFHVVVLGRAGRDPGGLADLIAAILSRGCRVARVPEGAALPAADGAPGIVLGALAPADRTRSGGAPRAVRDVRGLDVGAVLELIEEAREELGASAPSRWVPWFPVIDYERCAGCRQCADFCLFGVYAMAEDGGVVVENPEQCKTNCPACSRLCPEVAILFPKYKAGPLSGDEVGAVPETGVAQGGPTRVDVSALVGSDLHAALRKRGRQRFSTDPNAAAADASQAGGDRCACESPLARLLDVPMDTVRMLTRADMALLRERAERVGGRPPSHPSTPGGPEETREPS